MVIRIHGCKEESKHKSPQPNTRTNVAFLYHKVNVWATWQILTTPPIKVRSRKNATICILEIWAALCCLKELLGYAGTAKSEN